MKMKRLLVYSGDDIEIDAASKDGYSMIKSTLKLYPTVFSVDNELDSLKMSINENNEINEYKDTINKDNINTNKKTLG